jgi:Tol biopolymer transport system component
MATGAGILLWTRDGSAILASSSERVNVFSYDLASGERRQLTNLRDDEIVRGALTADGRHLVAARGEFNRDAFAIRNFRAAHAP